MKDFVVIVTGSTSGIGLSTAENLLKSGASVVVNGRNKAKVDSLLEKYADKTDKIIGVVGDVSVPQTGERLVSTAIDKFGKVNVLINNAGTVNDGFLYKMTNEQFTEIIDIHVNGNFYCTKPFVQKLKELNTPGHIINITSGSGLIGNIGQVNYSAAKAAINGITYTLASELKRDQIIVNAIAPIALTEMTRPFFEKAKAKAEAEGKPIDPLWDLGSPDDVADFIVELLKSKNSEQSGNIYGVNGKHITYWKPPTQIPLSEYKAKLNK